MNENKTGCVFPRQHGRGGWGRRQYLPNLHTHMAKGRTTQNIKFSEKLRNKSLLVMSMGTIPSNPDSIPNWCKSQGRPIADEWTIASTTQRISTTEQVPWDQLNKHKCKNEQWVPEKNKHNPKQSSACSWL